MISYAFPDRLKYTRVWAHMNMSMHLCPTSLEFENVSYCTYALGFLLPLYAFHLQKAVNKELGNALC